MSHTDSVSAPAPAPASAAAVVRSIAASAGAEGLEYREILRRADRRGYAPFILFAALLLLLPINIFFPQLAALTLLVCGAGLFFNAPTPWLPLIAKRKANQAALDKVAGFIASQESWLSAIVAPRHPELSTGAGEKTAALAMILIGVSVAAPLPHVIPALAALALALGLFERDGLVLMIGAAVSFGWVAFLTTMLGGLVAGASFASDWGQDHALWLVKIVGGGGQP